MKDVVLRGGPPVHPFVFAKRVRHVAGRVRDGDVVRLRTREGRPCGFGFYHHRSLVSVRVLSYDPRVHPDEAWLRRQVRDAFRLRTRTLRLPERTSAWRVVHGEGDGLSGLVVDRYGSVAVAALFSLGWQRRMDEVESVLREEVGVQRVFFRSDTRAQTQEGIHLPPAPPSDPVEIEEDGIRYVVDPTGGHKTGFFLDQRENRLWLGGLAGGLRVFDGMTYTGGFALAAARGGATHVRAMDLDEEALRRAQENARRNGCESIQFDHGDVFDALRDLASRGVEDRPDVVIVDPPKWAKDRSGLSAALARYRDLNRLALQSVAPGGLVVTNSCSGLVSEVDLVNVVRSAALDTRRAIRFLRVAGAGADHPVSGVFPEGRYLKCLGVQVGEPGSGPGGGSRGQ